MNQVTLKLTPVSVCGDDIPFSQSVRNLGLVLDETLYMDVHIKYLCSVLFYQSRKLCKMCPFLFSDVPNKLFLSYSQD